jgi:putative spermidine/putrescine transport system substrate-binding protein
MQDIVSMTQRVLLAMCALLGSIVVSGSAHSQSQQQTLVIVSAGGSSEEALRKTMLTPFEQQTGIKIVFQSPPLEAKLKAEVESGRPQSDLYEIRGILFRPDADKYLEPIDYSLLSKDLLDDLAPEAKQRYGVGSLTYSTVMAFSTKDFPPGKPRPQTWAEFWDVKKFPGPRSMGSAATGYPATLPFALLAAGVPKETVYPIDIDKAFASLEKIKPSIVKFWTVAAETGQLLIDREVTMASGYNGRIAQLQDTGAPVDIEWAGGELTMIYWVIPKGAPHKAAAMKFIEFASQPKAQAEFNKIMYYGPSNRKALDYMDAKTKSRLPTAPANLEKQFWRDDKWLESHTPSGKTNLEVIIDRWNQWVLK